MEKVKHMHFVGIKGVGMTPLAVIAKEAGFRVSGCDTPEIYITDELLQKSGIEVFHEFNESHLAGVDLLITTGAHGGFDNPEVKAAKEKNIPILTQGEAVGYYMSGELSNRHDLEGVSVAGCHGKTTTTAMIATMLQDAGKDPSYVIGTGRIPSLSGSGHYGKGRYFIAEADEYATEPTYDKTPKFLWQHPSIAVITNIEYDHPDLYPTFASLVEAYKSFIVQVLESDGQVVACGDDKEIQHILKNTKKNVITYGFHSDNDYVLSSVESVVEGMKFRVATKGKTIATITIPILGKHNCLNALGAFVVGHIMHMELEEIKKGLHAFRGTKRRLEYVGKMKSGAAVFDDYAHHPTEIRKTLATVRERYKDKNIVSIFQPHTFSRTKLLFEDFSSSFSDASFVILADIYPSKREPFDAFVSSKYLAQAVSLVQQVLYLPKLSDVVQYLREKQFGSDTIILTMGAGDVYQIAYEIID